MNGQEKLVPESEKRFWVVFTGQTDLKRLFFLKQGFRHCFVVMHDGSRWVSVDPLAGHIEVQVHDIPQDFDLPRWLMDQGHRVVAAAFSVALRPAPLMPLTCVEEVKRILGLRSRFIVTPWQLYRHLQREASARHCETLRHIKGEESWEV